MRDWEKAVAGAVGDVIEAWGFKRNQGRVWALLYLRGVPMTAAEVQRELGLSKGAVSMVTRELERWGIITRERAAHDDVWRFVAETDFLKMISRVIREREGTVIARVRAALDMAERAAAQEGAPKELRERLSRMKKFAAMFERAMEAFIKTSKFDMFGFAAVLSPARRKEERI